MLKILNPDDAPVEEKDADVEEDDAPGDEDDAPVEEDDAPVEQVRSLGQSRRKLSFSANENTPRDAELDENISPNSVNEIQKGQEDLAK